MILYVWHHCAWKITKLPRLTLCFSLLFLKIERWEGYHQRMPLHRGRPAGIRCCLLRPVRSGHQCGVVCPLVGAAWADWKPLFREQCESGSISDLNSQNTRKKENVLVELDECFR